MGLRQFTPCRDEQVFSFFEGEEQRTLANNLELFEASLVLDGSIWILCVLSLLCWNGLQLLDSCLFSLGSVQMLFDCCWQLVWFDF